MLGKLAALGLVVIVASAGCAATVRTTGPGATVRTTGPGETVRTTAPARVTPVLPSEPLPSAIREFRAAWIATVANIDWPSERGLTADSQRTELRALLDQASHLGLNAVVFQVRPMADALYASELEPWSTYLTGEQGVGPGYDPLEYAVEQAHLRGIELHAWFNPFRAGHPTNEGSFAPNHVRFKHPDWVRDYGDLLWLDPGSPDAVAHSLAVILDVVGRYDVDGVHLDDYFYPYPIQDSLGEDVPFPDDATWEASGYRGSRSDWRRSNVDHFIETLYDSVKALSPRVKVGISPFGIWRPGFPEGIEGFDQYERLYADARRWLHEGWVDYLTPQLYWALESVGQPYGPLLDWWVGENIHKRHMWPGNYASRVILEGASYWGPDELVRQVRHTRSTEGATGNVFFSMKALMPGVGADQMLADSVWAGPAIVPETSWLGGATPGPPLGTWQMESLSLSLEPGRGDPPFVWHIREWSGESWTVRIRPGHERSIEYREDVPEFVVVSAVNRMGQEGPPVWVTAGGLIVE
jgi:uncharacterized lipoprotein YddW (UPF0748 family)